MTMIEVLRKMSVENEAIVYGYIVEITIIKYDKADLE